jgi:hypothetical protein
MNQYMIERAILYVSALKKQGQDSGAEGMMTEEPTTRTRVLLAKAGSQVGFGRRLRALLARCRATPQRRLADSTER